MYKVMFRVEGRAKIVTLFADEVVYDMPLIIVKKIRQEVRSGVLTLPDDDYDEFCSFEHVTIPYSSLGYVGKAKEEEKVARLGPHAIQSTFTRPEA